MNKIAFMFLCLMTASCSFTGKLWEGYERSVYTEAYTGNTISVAVLNANEIAIFVSPKADSWKDRDQFRNFALIYRFNESQYSAIKDDIKLVNISEDINLSFKEKNITKTTAKFVIILNDGLIIEPEYIDVTLAERSKNEIIFTNKKITFNRHINVEGKKIFHDNSYLYRLPLTPIAVSADAVQQVGITAAVIAVLPVLGIMCMIGPCN